MSGTSTWSTRSLPWPPIGRTWGTDFLGPSLRAVRASLRPDRRLRRPSCGHAHARAERASGTAPGRGRTRNRRPCGGVVRWIGLDDQARGRVVQGVLRSALVRDRGWRRGIAPDACARHGRGSGAARRARGLARLPPVPLDGPTHGGRRARHPGDVVRRTTRSASTPRGRRLT